MTAPPSRHRIGFCRPMPAATTNCCRAAADTTGIGELVFRHFSAIDISHFEQSKIGEAAIGIALCRGDKTGQETWPHVRHVGSDRVRKSKRWIAAAKMLGLCF